MTSTPERREGGWIRLHRRLRSSALFRSLTAEQRSVFLSVLLLANWKDDRLLHGGQWVTIHRGELAHSLATLAKESATTVKVVRTTLAKLLADDSPAGGRGPFLRERWTGTEKGTGLRVLRVRRYEEYQGDGPETGTGNGKEGAQQGHDAGTTGAPREEDQEAEEAEVGGQPASEWTSLQAVLQRSVREDLYRAWFAPLSAKREGQTLVVLAPNDQHRRKVEADYAPFLQEKLEALGQGLALRFGVARAP